jgi:peptide/nickel transport system ATP-binding protein
MSTLLEVKDLKKYFKTPRGLLHAVDGVNFTLNEGSTLGIVGESGCGKSTLGRVILRLLDPTDGEIIFNGKDVTSIIGNELHDFRRNMQMIFQDPFSSINPRMMVYNIIGEPLQIYKIYKDETEYDKKVRSLMDTVGLAERVAYQYPHELDGGRRQRVGIARALAINPKFIVCDEPVSALDVSIQAQILNLLQDLQKDRGLTYMFITHDLSVVRHISNDISVMYLGVMVEKSPSKDLFKRQYHPYTQALLSAIPQPKLVSNKNRIILKGELASPINVKEGCRFAPRCLYAKDECRNITPKLREIVPNRFVACHFPLNS